MGRPFFPKQAVEEAFQARSPTEISKDKNKRATLNATTPENCMPARQRSKYPEDATSSGIVRHLRRLLSPPTLPRPTPIRTTALLFAIRVDAEGASGIRLGSV